jgi:3-hydroxyacyl-CoA dehydrogenase/enoyl-CoA hydratase/3-hydroxybutyryl-CoA epimerase
MTSALAITNESGIAVLTLDLPGEPVNKLNAAVKQEFEATFTRLRDDAAIRAVVLLSGKPDTFIAGADIEEFTRLSTQSEFETLSREGQEMLQRVADFPKPVVAAIHGTCLGGGLELALACRYRLCTDHPKTSLGLPEIQLGLLPGAGGCQRLPRLIGLRAALDLILSGKSVPGARAYRLGLVDELVPPSILRATALGVADRLAREGLPKRKPRGGLVGWLLERNPVGRRVVYALARRRVVGQTRGHYPAPLAALAAVRAGLELGGARGYVVEHQKFGELAVTDVSRKLVQLFFATTALKKDDGVPAGTATPRPVERVAVIGSGFMGAGIAGTAVSQADVDVRLRDTEWKRVAAGVEAATAILRGRLKRRRITRYEFERLAARLTGTVDYSGFRRADLVIEAVFEDLEIKRKVLQEVEAATGPQTIFATNTSTIPIEQIAAPAKRPERVLGMHFFSPVDRMPLVEIIPTAATSPESIVSAVRFGRKLGKTVIVVRDRPGFWVNRILSPYLNEAGRLLEEGTPIDFVDQVMTRFGFPVGPFALLDEVGLDVAAKAGAVMHHAYGERLKPSEAVGRMLGNQRLGRKSGRGFYLYHKGHKTSPDEKVYDLLGVRPAKTLPAELVERRLVYAMLNEAVMAEGEGVVRSPRDGDIGAIFGIGFPPFRGGPLRMIDDLGAARVLDSLNELVGRSGDRFAPAPRLREMAERGTKYYL